MITRRIVTLTSALALVAANLVSGTASPALAAPQEATSWMVALRGSPSGESITLDEGTEVGEIEISTSVGPDWDGWNHAKKGKVTFSADEPTIEVTPYVDYSWYTVLNGTSDTDPDCIQFGQPKKLVVKVSGCVDRVTLTMYLGLDGLDGAPLDVSTDIDSNNTTSRFVANGVAITSATGREASIVANTIVDGLDEIVVSGAEVQTVTVDLPACVDESLVEPGDVLDIVLEATNNGTAISETPSDSVPWVEWEYSWDAEGDTLTVPDWTPLEDVGAGGIGTIHLPNSGTFTLTASADNQLSGVSVLEECPITSGEEWVSPSSTSATNATVNATTATHSLPGSVVWDDSPSTEQVLGDGFGGIFIHPEPQYLLDDSEIATASVSAFDAAGSVNFTGDGSETMPIEEWTGARPVRWGPNGENWAVLSSPDLWEWTLTTGSLTSNDQTDVVFTASRLAALCGLKKLSYVLPTINASATESLHLDVTCNAQSKKSVTHFTVLASVDPDALNPLTFVSKFGSPDPATNYTGTNLIGQDNTATGSETAGLWWNQNVTFLKKGYRINSFIVTKLAADGTVTHSTISSDPFGSIEYLDGITMVPATTAGHWVGVTHEWTYNEVTGEDERQSHLVTYDGSTGMTLGASISATDTNGDDCEIVPVAALDATHFAFTCTVATIFDSVETVAESVGIANTSNRTVAMGERVVGAMSAYSDHVSHMGTWGVDADGNPVSYWITSPTEYSVVTWELP